jgi:hypothetical protein
MVGMADFFLLDVTSAETLPVSALPVLGSPVFGSPVSASFAEVERKQPTLPKSVHPLTVLVFGGIVVRRPTEAIAEYFIERQWPKLRPTRTVFAFDWPSLAIEFVPHSVAFNPLFSISVVGGTGID